MPGGRAGVADDCGAGAATGTAAGDAGSNDAATDFGPESEAAPEPEVRVLTSTPDDPDPDPLPPRDERIAEGTYAPTIEIVLPHRSAPVNQQ